MHKMGFFNPMPCVTLNSQSLFPWFRTTSLTDLNTAIASMLTEGAKFRKTWFWSVFIGDDLIAISSSSKLSIKSLSPSFCRYVKDASCVTKSECRIMALIKNRWSEEIFPSLFLAWPWYKCIRWFRVWISFREKLRRRESSSWNARAGSRWR